MEWLFWVAVFVFGAIIGSFVNAVVFRLRTGESFLVGRSHCMSCGHKLGFWDLVPAMSWLMLRGRCRYCRDRISFQYVMVEIALGAAFAIAAGVEAGGGSWTRVELIRLLRDWYALAILTIVFIYDWRYYLILPKVTLPATALLLAANFAIGLSWPSLLGGLAVGVGFFGLQFVLSRGRWIGAGDIYLGALLGALLGFQRIWVALFLAYVGGAVVGVALLALKRKGWRSELPFGTFLSVAAAASLLFGDRLLAWYFGML